MRIGNLNDFFTIRDYIAGPAHGQSHGFDENFPRSRGFFVPCIGPSRLTWKHFTGWASAVAGLAAEPLLPCGSGRPEQRQRPRRCACVLPGRSPCFPDAPGTIAARSPALGASTPWKRIRCRRGRGTSAARLSSVAADRLAHPLEHGIAAAHDAQQVTGLINRQASCNKINHLIAVEHPRTHLAVKNKSQ